MDGLHCGLITRSNIPDAMFEENMHLQGLLGDWLYKKRNELLESNVDVQAIEKAFRELCGETYILALLHTSGKEITPENYNRFIEHMDLYQEQVMKFRDALVEAKGIFDPLTGLLGRQALSTILSNEHARVARGNQACAIAMLDIDHFKTVNDNYGHQAGDSALCYVGQSAKFSLRPYDSLFRYGGEEFLICLPNTDVKDALLVMDRLRETIAELPLDLPNDETFHVTVSIGVAPLQPDLTVMQSIAEADKALYAAKESGRNRVISIESPQEP